MRILIPAAHRVDFGRIKFKHIQTTSTNRYFQTPATWGDPGEPIAPTGGTRIDRWDEGR
jgi:hypothetical protein